MYHKIIFTYLTAIIKFWLWLWHLNFNNVSGDAPTRIPCFSMNTLPGIPAPPPLSPNILYRIRHPVYRPFDMHPNISRRPLCPIPPIPSPPKITQSPSTHQTPVTPPFAPPTPVPHPVHPPRAPHSLHPHFIIPPGVAKSIQYLLTEEVNQQPQK